MIGSRPSQKLSLERQRMKKKRSSFRTRISRLEVNFSTTYRTPSVSASPRLARSRCFIDFPCPLVACLENIPWTQSLTGNFANTRE